MKLVCVSDTHNQLADIKIPEGDVLIHAGDLTMTGEAGEIERELQILNELPHLHKLLIAGNHDFAFQNRPGYMQNVLKDYPRVTYLQDECMWIGNRLFYGSPWTPEFGDWAFMRPRGLEMALKWKMIPIGVDVLITHGPANGERDLVSRGENVGCQDLRIAKADLLYTYHIFGHIHCGYGISDRGQEINASICNERYEPVNPPIVVELS